MRSGFNFTKVSLPESKTGDNVILAVLQSDIAVAGLILVFAGFLVGKAGDVSRSILSHLAYSTLSDKLTRVAPISQAVALGSPLNRLYSCRVSRFAPPALSEYPVRPCSLLLSLPRWPC
jgi:hypothetical protein